MNPAVPRLRSNLPPSLVVREPVLSARKSTLRTSTRSVTGACAAAATLLREPGPNAFSFSTRAAAGRPKQSRAARFFRTSETNAGAGAEPNTLPDAD
jgi:hypothetical protein